MAKTRVRRSLDLRLAALAAGVGGGTLLASTVAKAVAVALAGAVVTGGVWVVRQADRKPEPPARTEAKTRPAVSTPAPPPQALEQELGLLTGAQQAMRDGAPERALLLLDRHAAAFPAGAMAEERTAARALALCEVGRIDDARTAARGFLAKWPDSPLARRMTEVCPPRHEAAGQRPQR